MKKLSLPRIALALLLSALPAAAQTTFFTDTFTTSTTNGLSNVTGSPTASVTSYDIASTKNSISGTAGTTIAPNDFRLALPASTSSGFLEAQAMFRTNGQQLPLATVGDNIEIAVVFTNSTGTLLSGTKGALWIGLYNSGGALPLTTNLSQSGLSTTAGSPYASGNCAGWQGYVAQINATGGTTKLYTRPAQANNGTSAAQDLVAGGFGSGSYVDPGSTTISTGTSPAASILATSGAYTLDLRLTLTSQTSLTISNFIFAGAGTGGAVVFSQGSTGITNSNGTFLTDALDGFAIGSGASGVQPVMDISSITITGQSTPITTPPTITQQPTPVVVATGGACQFTINAVGSGVTYQWYRNHAPLSNVGDISGATSSTLVISPAGAGDAFSGTSGYYCVVTGTGNYSTNSVTNSLSVISPTTLYWSGGGTVWDVANTSDWVDNTGTSQVFNYGDPVVLADTLPGGGTVGNEAVSLSGSFISPSTVTIKTAQAYTLEGSGSLAGPGNVVIDGMASGGAVIMNVGNAYSGGTLLTNDTYVQLKNFSGFGTGPVTVNDAGGTLETTVGGGNTTGIGGLNVLDNFTIQTDFNGTYAFVWLGDLSGTAGKTLTINPQTGGTTNRYRAYGTNTTFNANLILDNIDSPVTQAIYNGTVLAPYGASGTQTYNGVISGVGGIVQRGNGNTVLNNNGNTYSGGTVVTAGNIGIGADSQSGLSSGPLGTGQLIVAPEVGSANGTGGIYASGAAHTIANPVVFPSNTNNQTLQVGGSFPLTLSGAIGLNGADGSTGPIIRTFQVTNSALTTFSGVISDGGQACSLTKTGAGVLALNAAETYTGTNTVSAGTLLVNGSVGAGPVNVATNATLGGSGTIAGAVTLTNGATIAPGNQAIGTLTINNTLTMQAGSTNYFLVSKTGSLKSVITATTVNYNGVLFATNISGTSVLGDTYTIYNAGSHTGTFTSVAGTPGSGLAWSFNPATGVLSVITGTIIPTVSPKISSITLTGGNVSISATNGVNGGTYYLLGTTNLTLPLSQWVSLSTNVVTASGGSASFTFNGTNVYSGTVPQRYFTLSSTNN